ncbi:NADP-dependent oxidoreductase [Lacticigenium naphthae]|uniref:NADP-dependent oxidoreductase n=1 Tax=Lacticigenium naphthae TaxID=515351 RepID=UPI00040FEC64|nr:NADP-dependent oxidoreductase [Lacticigenium naphthae]
MKAIAIEKYGSKEVLKEMQVEEPKANAKQVVVEVKATSVNPIDWKLREGYLQKMMDWQFPIILGWDVSGIISEIGNEVIGWKVGDRVFARPETTRFGTYAEYTIVDQSLLAKIPENISFEEAAAVPLAGLTAWQGLFNYGKLKEGETVLVHAGAGGVGTYAIQLAKSVGAKVITTASQKNHDLLFGLGADQVIDYKTDNFAELLNEIDLVLDTVGGEVQKESFKVLKQKTGRMISIVGLADEEVRKQYDVGFESIWLEPNGRELTEIANLMAAGKVKSVIGSKYPLTEKGIYEAHGLSETHHALGKIVIVSD